jgi:hypothetical protein
VALRVATDTPVDGVIAINPQLYWQPGDPVEALLADTRIRRTDEIAEFAANGARLESEADPHPASRWLSRFRASGPPVLALFAAGDDGLEFLRDRLPGAWAAAVDSGAVQVVEIEGIDHPMHRRWRRGDVVAAMLTFLEARVAYPRTPVPP